MNDVDYQSTLECLRIAVRLIMPLDLDGFLERAEALAQAEADGESRLGIRRLARLARAIRDDDGARENAAAAHAPRRAPPQLKRCQSAFAWLQQRIRPDCGS
jgi:hypothetical protein